MGNSSTNFTHRVTREFPSGDFVFSVGDLVSDADWTYQGKQYVETMGWVVPLTPAELAELAASDEATEAAEIAPVATEEETAPVAKTAPKRPAKPKVKKPE